MDVLMRLNWVDLLVLIIMARTIYGAFKEGLSHEIFPLFGSIASLLLALYYYEKIGSAAAKSITLPVSILNFTSFFLIIFVCKFIFRLLKAILNSVIKVTWHPLIEKFGGILAGLVRGGVAASTILIILALLPLSYLQWSIRERSLSGMYFLRIGPSIYEIMSGTPMASAALSRELVKDKSMPAKPKKATDNIPDWQKVSKY